MPKIIIVHYEEDPESIFRFRLASVYNWDDHINFTRDAIISILAGLEDTQPIIDRLMLNQDAIAQQLLSVYGGEEVLKLAELLKAHIVIAGDIVKFSKQGKNTTEYKKQWNDNAKSIADFLASLDPISWPSTETTAKLATHLECTVKQIESRLKRDWTTDLQAYDAGHKAIVDLAEYLSAGIIAKFPETFVKLGSYKRSTIKQ